MRHLKPVSRNPAPAALQPLFELLTFAQSLILLPTYFFQVFDAVASSVGGVISNIDDFGGAISSIVEAWGDVRDAKMENLDMMDM